jgi:hypothetical protein
MTAQLLPHYPLEQEGKAVVTLEKGMEVEENLIEETGKVDKIAALHSISFSSPATNLVIGSSYHSPLTLSPAKNVTTPPPNIC